MVSINTGYTNESSSSTGSIGLGGGQDLSAAKEQLSQANRAVSEASTGVNRAGSELSSANMSLSQAQQDLNQIAMAARQQQVEVTKMTQGLTAASQALAEKVVALSEQNEVVQKLNETLEADTKALEEAEGVLEEAESSLSDAEDALNSAEESLSAAETKLSKTSPTKTITKYRRNSDGERESYEVEVPNEPAYGNAKDAVKAATSKRNEAQEARDKAEAARDDAQEARDEAEKKMNETQELLTENLEVQAELQTQVAEQEAAVKVIQTNLNRAQQQLTQTLARERMADQQVSQRVQEVNQATAELNQARMVLQQAEQERAKAEQNLREAEAVEDDEEAQNLLSLSGLASNNAEPTLENSEALLFDTTELVEETEIVQVLIGNGRITDLEDQMENIEAQIAAAEILVASQGVQEGDVLDSTTVMGDADGDGEADDEMIAFDMDDEDLADDLDLDNPDNVAAQQIHELNQSVDGVHQPGEDVDFSSFLDETEEQVDNRQVTVTEGGDVVLTDADGEIIENENPYEQGETPPHFMLNQPVDPNVDPSSFEARALNAIEGNQVIFNWLSGDQQYTMLEQGTQIMLSNGESFAGLDMTALDGSNVLVGADFNGIDLSNANMAGLNMEGAMFSGANVQGTNFTDANLTLANFSGDPPPQFSPDTTFAGAILNGANLNGQNLAGVNFSGAELNGANMADTNLDGADLSDATMDDWLEEREDGSIHHHRPTLRNANLSNANLSGAAIHNTDFSFVNFSGTTFSDTTDLSHNDFSMSTGWIGGSAQGVNLSHSNFNGVDMSDVNLSGANLSHSAFSGVNFTGADLSGANLTEGDFSRTHNWVEVNLAGADLTRANFEGRQFTNADLTGADLSHANFNRASFEESILNETTLLDTNMEEARFTDSQLVNASLLDSNFTNAQFTTTNLSGSTLTQSNFTGASFTDSTLNNTNMNPTGGLQEGALFEGAHFLNSAANYADWSNGDFTNSTWDGGSFWNINLTNSNLTGATFTGVEPTPDDLASHGVSCGCPTCACVIPTSDDPDSPGLINFGGADFTGANLTYANFQFVDLNRSYFGGSTLDVAHFGNSNLTDIHGFDSAEFNMTQFFGNYMDGVDFSNSDFNGVMFNENQLTNTSFDGADIFDTTFSSNDFAGSHFSDADISANIFVSNDLRDVDLSGASISGNTSFSWNALDYGDELFELPQVSYSQSRVAIENPDDVDGFLDHIHDETGEMNFNGVIFGGIDVLDYALNRAHQSDGAMTFMNADLSELGYTPLRDHLALDAFSGLDFTNANMENVDLRFMDLSFANFSGADFTNTNITRANISGVNFTDAWPFSEINDAEMFSRSGIPYALPPTVPPEGLPYEILKLDNGMNVWIHDGADPEAAQFIQDQFENMVSYFPEFNSVNYQLFVDDFGGGTAFFGPDVVGPHGERYNPQSVHIGTAYPGGEEDPFTMHALAHEIGHTFRAYEPLVDQYGSFGNYLGEMETALIADLDQNRLLNPGILRPASEPWNMVPYTEGPEDVFNAFTYQVGTQVEWGEGLHIRHLSAPFQNDFAVFFGQPGFNPMTTNETIEEDLFRSVSEAILPHAHGDIHHTHTTAAELAFTLPFADPQNQITGQSVYGTDTNGSLAQDSTLTQARFFNDQISTMLEGTWGEDWEDDYTDYLAENIDSGDADYDAERAKELVDYIFHSDHESWATPQTTP